VPDSEFIRETLTTYGGTFHAAQENKRLRFEFLLPRDDVMTVLVVDDNVDLVHFYRRYVDGTHYRIVHVSEGRDVVSAAQSLLPAVIVLDVMLPDISGWRVLHDLQNNVQTRQIPIIVCSVVRPRALLQGLGVAGYLVKPIHRQEFLEALAQVQHARQA
jgi:CheY-like chemotaxis protein